MTIYFTGDTHFHHAAILKHCNRPFSNSYEMNETIIQNWNNMISPDDIVYHLGDFNWKGWKQADYLIKRLNGAIYLLPGNHDKRNNMPRSAGFTLLPGYFELKIQQGKQSVLFVLCHYPIENWNKKHYGSYHLHGHSHGNTLYRKGHERRIDIGVDCWNYRPVSIDQIIKLSEERIECLQP